MSNEELIQEILHEAEELKLREYVINSGLNLMEKNPKMDRYEAYKLAFENAKLHSGLNYKK